jgi:hypothetical protein
MIMFFGNGGTVLAQEFTGQTCPKRKPNAFLGILVLAISFGKRELVNVGPFMLKQPHSIPTNPYFFLKSILWFGLKTITPQGDFCSLANLMSGNMLPSCRYIERADVKKHL